MLGREKIGRIVEGCALDFSSLTFDGRNSSGSSLIPPLRLGIHAAENTAGTQGGQHGVVEQRGGHDGDGGVDQRWDQLGDHGGPDRVHRVAVYKLLIDEGLEHVQRDVGQRAADAGQRSAVYAALAPGMHVACENRAADPRHGELADEGYQHVDEVVTGYGVVEGRTDACGQSALHRPEQYAAQQAYCVGEMYLGAQKGKAKQRDHVDDCGHHRYEGDVEHCKSTLVHKEPSQIAFDFL